MSNEKEIREQVKTLLSELYQGSVIAEEFGVFLDSRNDVMAIDDENIVSVEIKSDKDTFVRLEKQLNTYNIFSTSIYVALDISHYEKYKTTMQDEYSHVGVMVYKDKKLHVKRKAKKVKIPLLYDLLKSNELPMFFTHFKKQSLIPKNREVSNHLIKNIFTSREIYDISKAIFIGRFKRVEGFDKNLISKFDTKQKAFIEWTNEEHWNMYRPTSFLGGKVTKGKPKRSSLKCLKDLSDRTT